MTVARNRTRSLVLGADGLLGSHLVRRLLDRGHEVRVLAQPGTTSPTLDGLPIERVEGDLLHEGPALAETMQGCGYVFHCAAITDLWADRELMFGVNLEGTRRVCDAGLAAGVKRLVFVGSASSFQFGSQAQPGDETAGFPEAYRGIPYMESKHQAMQLVLSYVRERGLDAVVVAPTFMLGAYDWRPSSGELIRQYLARGFPLVPRGGRNFAYAPDVAAAMVAAAERGRTGECYLLGGHNLTYREFFTQVAELAGRRPPLGLLPRGVLDAAGLAGTLVRRTTGRRVALDRTLAGLAQLGTFYSIAKAQGELGMPLTPVRTAIAESIESLRDYGHINGNDQGFAGKVALISGASRGVGYATARALVERGARVVITARGETRLLDSQRKLEALGGEVAAVTGDVGQWDDAQRMVAAALDRFGRLDLLVNNAGVSMRGQFADLSPEVCTTTIATNLLGSVYLTRAASEALIASRGSVVFISSIAGLLGLPGASTYCASKSALTGLCESLRLELGPRGVHLGVLYLGFTEHDPEKRVLAADGTPVLPDRPAYSTQAEAAEAILELVSKRRRQRIMTHFGTLGWLAHRLSPSLVEGVIARAQASQWSLFKQFS